MIKAVRIAALLLAMLLAAPIAAPVHAQMSPGPEQVQLTDETVEGFIASYPELEALSDKYGSNGADDGPMGGIGDIARSQAAMAELNALLNKHGFGDIGEWSRVAFSVMLAHKWNEGGENPSSGLDKAIAEVWANKDMPDEQKQMIIAHLESQRETVKALEPLPGNVEVVQRHGDALEAATEN